MNHHHRTGSEVNASRMRGQLLRSIQARTLPRGRTARIRIACLALAVAVASTPVAAAQQDPYSDVTGGVHKPAIDELGDGGLFDGTPCGGGRFCPTEPIERSTMAVWLIRALADADPPQVRDSRFADVAAEVWWAGHVEMLAQLEITVGCGTNPLRYCPQQPVTRAQMASFLTRAFNLAPGPSAGFTDVDQHSSHAANINALAAAGITVGCGTAPLRYCPQRPVTRAQMATFLSRAYVPAIDLTGVTPELTVRIDDPTPTVGDSTRIVATVTDAAGTPLAGARLEMIVDGSLRDIAVAGRDGRATFTRDSPTGPPNEGGYDSIQVQVASTDVASRPTGVFWQPQQSRRITISASPDRPHTGAARTITARAVDGTSPLAGRKVELYIDGAIAGQATTGDDGVARFTRTAPVHGPFDLAKVVLAEDRRVASNELLFSWPMQTRGVKPGNGWELVWSDEFNGTSVDASKWRAINNCPPVYLACDTDRPENVYVSDGMLHLRSLRERYAGVNTWTSSGSQFGPLANFTPGEFQLKDFTAGRVDSAENFTYGRFELLGRLPQGHGTFFAYWMRPRNSPYGNDTAGGEIDIAEGANIGRGGNPRGQIDAQLPGPGWGVHHVVHMGYPFTNPVTLTNLKVNPAESFHLYAVEWDTASIRFYVDDQRVLTVPQSDRFSQPKGSDEPVDNPYAPFDVPFFIVINNTVGNWALETWPGHQVPDTTVFPAEFVVDYVRVYECRPPPGTSVAGPGQGCETR